MLAPPKSARMSGNAMLTMKRSRLATKVATETSVRTCQRRCISQVPYRGTGKMQATAIRSSRALPALREPELLDRARARGDRRALDAAGAARGLARPAPVRGDPAQHGHRDQHPLRPLEDPR